MYVCMYAYMHGYASNKSLRVCMNEWYVYCLGQLYVSYKNTT